MDPHHDPFKKGSVPVKNIPYYLKLNIKKILSGICLNVTAFSQQQSIFSSNNTLNILEIKFLIITQ